MKKYVWLLALACALSAEAASDWEIEQLAHSCEIEKFSLLREREGTPSCKKLAQLKKQQKKQNASSGKRKKASADAAPAAAEGHYRWNTEKGRYCYHNAKDRPTHCP